MSLSFIIIFPNHLVSGAGRGPTDLSSRTALVLLVGQQTREEANPAPFALAQSRTEVLINTEEDTGYWLLAGDEKALSRFTE